MKNYARASYKCCDIIKIQKDITQFINNWNISTSFRVKAAIFYHSHKFPIIVTILVQRCNNIE